MGRLPAASKGFWVAMTMKGRGRGWEMPSAETWRSSIASRSADWALGEARFSSSARRTLVKMGAGRKGEDTGVAVEDDRPGDVGGEEVGRELDAPEAETEGTRQSLGQGRLPHAGMVLDEEVPLGHEAAERKPDGELLPEVGGADVGHDGVESAGQLAGRRRDARSHGVNGDRGVVHTRLYVNGCQLGHLQPPLPTIPWVHGAS